MKNEYWKRKAVMQQCAVFRIEGESLTYVEIAKRLGVSVDTVRHRFGKLRDASGAITWDRLRAFGKAAA